MSVPLQTRKRVQYALGYIGLDLLREAANELDQVSASDQQLPTVRAVRVDLHMAAKDWEAVIDSGSELARESPECENAWIGWAYALRERQQIVEAREVLRIAELHHGGTSAVLHYNLACYESLLGDIQSARERLSIACRMEPRFKAESAADPDLEALRAADSRKKSGK